MSYYTNKEMQAVAIARQIKEGQIAIIGTGLPLVGAAVAKRCYVSSCKLIVESGIIDSNPKEVPTSVCDLRLMVESKVLWEQYRYVGFQYNAWKKQKADMISFIGGAQIDPYGNLNSTSIGDYHHPKSRFTGSGGANGIATFVNTVIMMQHQKRRFIEKIDYMTSPGWIDGPDGRAKKGLPADKGPQAVITELGIMRFDDKTKRMYVAEIFPGVSVDQIQENTGFEIDCSRAIETRPPEIEVIETIRNVIDPKGIFLKRDV